MEIINPELIELNTLHRPGIAQWIKPMNLEKILQIKELLQPLPVEIVSQKKNQMNADTPANLEETILSIIKRRPSSIDDLQKALGVPYLELENILLTLQNNNKIVTEIVNDQITYRSLFV